MKKNWMLFLFFAASAALTFSGCSDDDNSDVPENTHLVSKEVQAAFNAKYPQAKDVEWELKGDYAVVDFNWDGGEHSAYRPIGSSPANCCVYNPAAGLSKCTCQTKYPAHRLPHNRPASFFRTAVL